MSNLGFSLDRNFIASDATRLRAGGLPPLVSAPSDSEENSNPLLLGALAFAGALFGALAVLFLF
jgi:hypothetical protein